MAFYNFLNKKLDFPLYFANLCFYDYTEKKIISFNYFHVNHHVGCSRVEIEYDLKNPQFSFMNNFNIFNIHFISKLFVTIFIFAT